MDTQTNPSPKKLKLQERIGQIKKNQSLLIQSEAFCIDLIKALRTMNHDLSLEDVKLNMSYSCFEDELQFAAYLLHFKDTLDKVNVALNVRNEPQITLADAAYSYMLCRDSIYDLFESTLTNTSGLYFNRALILLPPEIQQLYWAEELDIVDCQFLGLNPVICLLTDLTSLNLSGNFLLSALPESIGNLTKLKTLDLDGLPLKKLPDSIVHLTNLTYLSFGECLCVFNGTNYDSSECFCATELITFDDLTTAQQEWLRELEKKGCEIEGIEIPS